MAPLHCIGAGKAMPMAFHTASNQGHHAGTRQPVYSRNAANHGFRTSTTFALPLSLKNKQLAEKFGKNLQVSCEASPGHSCGASVETRADKIPPADYLDYSESRNTPVGPDHCGEEKLRSTKVVEVPKRRSSGKPRVILIAGPTAVGKTRLSIQLAKTLGGEIINADSVQVYQGLDVGAAKATMEERQGIPHHVMDVVPPTVEYTYPQFLVDARQATERILDKGLVPIVIGGTGMYMRWYMHNRACITCHPFEGEAELMAGDGESDHWDYDFQAYFLYQHRADLYPRVDVRCEIMVPKLLEETSWLMDLGVQRQSNSAAKAIGYDEAMELLQAARCADGVVTSERLLQFVAGFQKNSKGLVRKQIAWFRDESRSEVRKFFRWIQAGGPVEEMVQALVHEYHRRPSVGRGDRGDLDSAELNDARLLSLHDDLRLQSMKEQKRMKSYTPKLEVYNDGEAIARTLAWIKATQSRSARQGSRIVQSASHLCRGLNL